MIFADQPGYGTFHDHVDAFSSGASSTSPRRGARPVEFDYARLDVGWGIASAQAWSPSAPLRTVLQLLRETRLHGPVGRQGTATS